MTLLVDHEIAERQSTGHHLATDVSSDNYKRADSPIQAASLDLTVGDIFVPGTDSDKPGGVNAPLGKIALQQGHTAVIRTKEEIDLGPNLAGIAFPPANLSLNGLLTTNPGHVDRGYHGPLHLTVINTSCKPFSLRRADRIMRVLLIPLDSQPEAPLDIRRPSPLVSPITPELLESLSIDFVDVGKRAQDIADAAVKQAKIWATGIPVIVALIGLASAYIAANLTVGRDFQRISETVAVIEAKSNQQDANKRIKKLEDEFAKIMERMSTGR